MKKLILSLATAAWIFLSFTGEIRAQQYTFEKWGNNTYYTPQELREPKAYKYVYGILTPGQDIVDYYSFDLGEYVPQFHIELFVPAAEYFKDFQPSLLLVDPHSSKMLGGKIPYSLPGTMGGRIYNWQTVEDLEVTEAGAFQKVRVGPKLIKDLLENRYLFGVYDPAGNGGRYMLKVGVENPAFSIKEWVKKLLAFIRVKTYLY